MMTSEEFAAASKKATSVEIKAGSIGVVAMILALASTNFLFARLPLQLTSAYALLSLIVYIALIAPWILVVWIYLRHTKRLRLQCPHCEKPFLAQDRKIVLSGGACCHCGKPVIARTHS